MPALDIDGGTRSLRQIIEDIAIAGADIPIFRNANVARMGIQDPNQNHSPLREIFVRSRLRASSLFALDFSELRTFKARK